MIRVLIADDHPVVRSGVRHILGDTSDVKVVGEAASAQELLDGLATLACDVVLLDVTMPGARGFELLETVKRARPRTAVLVLTMHPAEQYAVRALRAGAAGYMTKESAADELAGAIRKVSIGGRYVTPSVAETLAAAVDRGSDRSPHELLSNREYQVLCLLGRAFSVKDIARELHVSEKTVSTYRARVLEKIQARSTAELIRYAVQNRLVD